MSKFKIGDKVQAKKDITANCGTVIIAWKGDVGEVVNIYEELPFYGKEMFVAKFGEKQVLTGPLSVDKYEVEKIIEEQKVGGSYVERQAKCGLKVGDKVRVLRAAEYGEGGWIHPHSYLIKDYVGAVGEIRDFKEKGVKVWFEDLNSRFWPPYFVLEKLEPENTETPKTEKKLERITITLKNRQSAIVIIGNYLSSDAEFVYYESRDGKTYEIREDEIIMIVSEEIEQ